MIILNELEYAEECLYEKNIGEKPFVTLTILAKYYYHHHGYRKKKIIELLTDFISQYYPGYAANKRGFDNTIEKIASSAGKYPLYEYNKVVITDIEMQTIENIHNGILERLAFCALCIAKAGNLKNPKNNGWVNISEKELFKTARISGNTDLRSKRIGQLADLGLIELPKRNDNMSFRITFIAEGKEVLGIKDFRELGYEYQLYKGKPFIRCAECNILIKNNKFGNRKYCDNCAGYIPQRTKIITCVDCGKQFEVSSLNNQTSRCENCYTEYRKTKITEHVRNYRNKQ